MTDSPLPVTERVAGVDRSSIRVMFDMAERHDGDLVRLEVGEPDFDTPGHVTDAAFEAARAGDTHYTSNAGVSELREAIAERYRGEGVEFDPDEEVTVTTGAMEALHLAMLTVVEPGAEVVIPSPRWPNHPTQARLAEGVPVEVPLPADRGFELDPDRVIDAIGEATAAVVLVRPSNPTGRVFDPDAVREIAAVATDHDAYVVADEVYRELVYDGDDRPIASIVDRPDRVLTVDSCSKTFAMTGWRLGWLAGPAEVVGQATKIHESTTACASTISQRAAIAALTGPQEPFERMYEAFERRRDYVVDRLEAMPALSCVPPEGAFYAFVDANAFGEDSLSIAERLLREYGVVVAPGGGFGEAGRGYLRVSFANSMDRLESGLDGLEEMARTELD